MTMDREERKEMEDVIATASLYFPPRDYGRALWVAVYAASIPCKTSSQSAAEANAAVEQYMRRWPE